MGAMPQGGRAKASKAFFFEKKNQKTFAEQGFWPRLWPQATY
jgi:hypothetical protein